MRPSPHDIPDLLYFHLSQIEHHLFFLYSLRSVSSSEGNPAKPKKSSHGVLLVCSTTPQIIQRRITKTLGLIYPNRVLSYYYYSKYLTPGDKYVLRLAESGAAPA